MSFLFPWTGNLTLMILWLKLPHVNDYQAKGEVFIHTASLLSPHPSLLLSKALEFYIPLISLRTSFFFVSTRPWLKMYLGSQFPLVPRCGKLLKWFPENWLLQWQELVYLRLSHWEQLGDRMIRLQSFFVHLVEFPTGSSRWFIRCLSAGNPVTLRQWYC